ncbi:MAG TPA: Rv3235 family protein [Micromonosporaceae bacterium]|nr:Rv3235 family protein [Micromonosporaceae bacterium]
MTVTLIAEAEADQAAPMGIGRPDRRAMSNAKPATMPVRLRRPPASEPPYDPGFSGPSAPARLTAAPVGVRPERDPATAAVRAPGVAPAGVVPPVAASAQRYVRMCLEVLNGFRPASHLRTLAGPVEFSTVVSQLSRRRNGRGHFAQAADLTLAPSGGSAGRRAGQPNVSGPRNAGALATAQSSPSTAGVVRYVAPPSTVRRNAPGAAQPFRLLRLRLSEPRDGVAEIVAVLSYAGSSLAMALRLERHGDQWLCALVQVI